MEFICWNLLDIYTRNACFILVMVLVELEYSAPFLSC